MTLLRMANRSGHEQFVTLRSLQHPFLVRPAREDVAVIINNVFREEYGQFTASFRPKTIIDAGAYIGDTTAYFLTRFQDATVIALEPANDSHFQAAQNLAPYGDRVRLIKRALWNAETTLTFSGSETAAAISATGSSVQTDTVPSLMRRFNLQTIDLLKLDIEGAEAAVIPSGVGGWLRTVKTILVEIHGSDVERTILPLLAAEAFACHQYRSVWYCRNTTTAA
ncbi:MAG TPA: FkbM family methyltransferase [Vicinamibacterales bacterium]|nr:FkbM family methyltransferase [Vicinamibacterales bacterium]